MPFTAPSHPQGTDAHNNVGTTPEGAGDTGSLDASGLAEAGAGPGASLWGEEVGTEFTGPDTPPGEPDNWVPHGQRDDVEAVVLATAPVAWTRRGAWRRWCCRRAATGACWTSSTSP